MRYSSLLEIPVRLCMKIHELSKDKVRMTGATRQSTQECPQHDLPNELFPLLRRGNPEEVTQCDLSALKSV